MRSGVFLNKISKPMMVRGLSSANIKKLNYGGSQFTIPSIGQTGFTLTPKPYNLVSTAYNNQSPILKSLHTIWDLNQFKIPRSPLVIGSLKEEDRHSFNRLIIRVLDMPIKLAGSNDYVIPDELKPFSNVVQSIIDHEHSILSDDKLLEYNAYVTIDQSEVIAGKMQRKPGAHVDGFQGARISPKTFINHTYVVSNGTPTVFYPQSFDFTNLNEGLHDFFKEMDRQADGQKTILTQPYEINLMDAYTVHRASAAKENLFRTFLRISYDPKPFDRLGNTINPLLPYQWEMVPREVQSTLVRYQPLSEEDINFLENAKYKILLDQLKKLKEKDLDYYCNFIYTGLISTSTRTNYFMLEYLASINKILIHELRLFFIAATQSTDSGIAINAKAAFIYQFQHATDGIANNVLLDFLLEVVTQRPSFLEPQILNKLVEPYKEIAQAKHILKSICPPSMTNNPNLFWNNPVTGKKEFGFNPIKKNNAKF